jgi:hypothetical protein
MPDNQFSLLLTALSSLSKAVVFKVSKAAGTALDELLFSMESLGDPIGAYEMPHP